MENNLWGSLEDVKCGIRNPKDILEEQADFLREGLDGLVRGSVMRGTVADAWRDFYNGLGVSDAFVYYFRIISDYVEKYEYEAFKIAYGVKLYPLAISFGGEVNSELESQFVVEDGDTIVVENEEEFYKVLKGIFSTNELRQVLKGLVSMASKEKESSDFPF